jgi:hypothetical protein
MAEKDIGGLLVGMDLNLGVEARIITVEGFFFFFVNIF